MRLSRVSWLVLATASLFVAAVVLFTVAAVDVGDEPLPHGGSPASGSVSLDGRPGTRPGRPTALPSRDAMAARGLAGLRASGAGQGRATHRFHERTPTTEQYADTFHGIVRNLRPR